MPTRPLKIAALLTFLQLMSPDLAPAEEGSDPLKGWEPSLGVVVGLDFQTVKGSSSSTDLIQGPSAVPPRNPGPIRPASNGDVLNTQPTVGIEFGILSPAVAPIGDASLRLFAHANVEGNLAAETVATREDARGAMRPPVGSTGEPVAQFSEIGIIGQGTRAIVDFDALQVRAGAGIAFEMEFRDRPFRVRTSLEYIRKGVSPRAGVSRAIQIVPGIGIAGNANDFENDFRFAILDTEQTVTLHGIGPAIEAEVDVARMGPTTWSIFGGFNAYRFLGDLETESTVANAAPFGVETATFKFEFEEWVYRINGGFRIRWNPN